VPHTLAWDTLGYRRDGNTGDLVRIRHPGGVVEVGAELGSRGEVTSSNGVAVPFSPSVLCSQCSTSRQAFFVSRGGSKPHPSYLLSGRNLQRDLSQPRPPSHRPITMGHDLSRQYGLPRRTIRPPAQRAGRRCV
jgi:hypothetical protein